jgi:hypothetical protein
LGLIFRPRPTQLTEYTNKIAYDRDWNILKALVGKVIKSNSGADWLVVKVQPGVANKTTIELFLVDRSGRR